MPKSKTEIEHINFMARLPKPLHAELKLRMDTALQYARWGRVKLPSSRVSPVTMNDQIVRAITSWLESREADEYFFDMLEQHGVEEPPPLTLSRPPAAPTRSRSKPTSAKSHKASPAKTQAKKTRKATTTRKTGRKKT